MVVNCEDMSGRRSPTISTEKLTQSYGSRWRVISRNAGHCTAVLDGTRNVIQLYGDDRLYELPAGFSRRLQRRLMRNPARPGLRQVCTPSGCWPSLAVALLAGRSGAGNLGVFAHPDSRSRLAQPAHRIPPELKVVVSSEGRLFHVPGCRYLHNKVGETPETLTVSEAMRDGYAPCSALACGSLI